MYEKMKKTILYITGIILLISFVIGQLLDDQQAIDNINVSSIDISKGWVEDTKKNKIVNVTGERCILYHTIEIIEKEYEMLDYTSEDMGIIKGNWTGRYIYKNTTKEIWIPCYQLKDYTTEKINTILDEKLSREIVFEKEKIKRLQTKKDYDISGVII